MLLYETEYSLSGLFFLMNINGMDRRGKYFPEAGYILRNLFLF